MLTYFSHSHFSETVYKKLVLGVMPIATGPVIHCHCRLSLEWNCKKGGPITTKGRRGVADFYAHHFSVSTILCDGGAYLLSIAALPLPSPKEDSYSLLHLYSCSWLSRSMPMCAVARLRIHESQASALDNLAMKWTGQISPERFDWEQPNFTQTSGPTAKSSANSIVNAEYHFNITGISPSGAYLTILLGYILQFLHIFILGLCKHAGNSSSWREWSRSNVGEHSRLG